MIRIFLFTALLTATAGAQQTPSSVQKIEAAKQQFEEENYNQVIKELAPLADGEGTTSRVARQILAAAHQRRGEDHFRNGRIEPSIDDFDQLIAFFPSEEPGHWQRGISHFYAGRFADGKRQFEIHRTVNAQDVENAVWHLLCAANVEGASLVDARTDYIPIRFDGRVPMMEIHRLFGGSGTIDEVVRAAAENGSDGAKFYADLYLGLYHELIGDEEKGMTFIARAAANPSAKHYMGDVARTHLLVRNQEAGASTLEE